MTAPPQRRPRSIIFLGTAHDNGGTSILATNLAEAMRAQGHHVEEWYLFGSQGDVPAGARLFEPGTRSRSPFVFLRLFFRLVNALGAKKPDVLFGLQPVSNILVGVAGRIAGVPHRVPTYHGPREWVNPVFATIDSIVNALGFYTEMIACANSVAATFKRKGLAVVVNGQSVPKGFSRAEARAALGLPVDGLVLGQLGRLSYQKNQSFSLDLLQQLPDASLVLVGIGPDDATIKSQIEKRGLQQRVHIVASIPHDRIGLFFSAVDLVLFPSRYEGLSLAAIEAIHAGVPPLCADIPSFREMFVGSPTLTSELLLPITDPSAWPARIHKLLAEHGLRNRIVSELTRLSPAFGFETMAQRYLRVVE